MMYDPNDREILRKKPLAVQLGDETISPLRRYREKVLGAAGWAALLRYELAVMLSTNVSGGAGYLLRKMLLKPLFRQTGPGLILGRGLTLRHPGRITLGTKVAIDDDVLLDAAGTGEEGITLGDEVIVSRNCVIQGKTGPVRIGDRADIGCNTVISSASGVHIGRCALIAANCYLGGAQYVSDRLDVPIMDQGSIPGEVLSIGQGVWLGAGVIVLDGVNVGDGCIVGAGAVVARDIPPYAVAVGVPARVLRMREGRAS